MTWDASARVASSAVACTSGVATKIRSNAPRVRPARALFSTVPASVRRRTSSVRTRCARHASVSALSVADATKIALERVEKARETKKLDLSGLGLRAIPVEALELRDLVELQVSNNNLYEIPEALFENCSKIERLGLAGNRLRALPDSTGGLVALRGLWAHGNCLRRIPASIGNCEALRNFVVGGNYLSELPSSIAELKNLEELSAPGNRLREIPDLGSMPLLREIDLHGNFIERLPEDLSGLRALETLSLQGNRLREIPRSITKLRRLRALNLAENAMETIPDDVSEMTMLTSLWLYSNDLTSLPGKSVKKMLSIKQMWIEGNENLDGDVLDAFARDVSGHKTLQTLGVDQRQAARMKTLERCVSVAEIPEGNPRGYFKLVRWGNDRDAPRAPVLIVSFGSAPGVPNWGGLLKKLQKNVKNGDAYDVLYVCDVERSWYASNDASVDQDAEFERWSAPLRDACAPYERVLYIGDSMGASASLMFAEHATRVLAFCPQVDLYAASIRPSRSNVWFKRFKRVMTSALEKSTAAIDVHTGSWDHDKHQASLLPQSKVTHVVHQVDSHRLALALDGEEKLLPIIKDAFEAEIAKTRADVDAATASKESTAATSKSLNAFTPWQSVKLR